MVRLLEAVSKGVACMQCNVCMVLVPENSRERLLLPLDPPKTGTIGPAKVETLRAVGILMPETQHALDWLWRHKATNGMASAFLKVGGRRCIDLVEFARLMRSKQA